MKKILLLTILLFTVFTYSQKGKKTVASPGKTTIGKSENITAELLKKKDAYRFYLLINAPKNKKDTVSLKTFAYDPKAAPAMQNNNVPANCVITPFTAKGISLHNISWTEKTLTEVKDKKEEATRTVSEIWDLQTKIQLHSNVQTVTKITEILYLDKLKNASQTSEKMRYEGFALTLSKEGDIILKNRTQENKLVYDATEKKFMPVKIQLPTPAPTKKKK